MARNVSMEMILMRLVELKEYEKPSHRRVACKGENHREIFGERFHR